MISEDKKEAFPAGGLEAYFFSLKSHSLKNETLENETLTPGLESAGFLLKSHSFKNETLSRRGRKKLIFRFFAFNLYGFRAVMAGQTSLRRPCRKNSRGFIFSQWPLVAFFRSFTISAAHIAPSAAAIAPLFANPANIVASVHLS